MIQKLLVHRGYIEKKVFAYTTYKLMLIRPCFYCRPRDWADRESDGACAGKFVESSPEKYTTFRRLGSVLNSSGKRHPLMDAHLQRLLFKLALRQRITEGLP